MARRLFHSSRILAVSSHVSSLEVAAKRWVQSPTNRNVCPALAADQRRHLGDALAAIRQANKPKTPVLVSPLVEGLASGSPSYAALHERLQSANHELASYGVVGGRLSFSGFLSPRFALAAPTSPPWFVDSQDKRVSADMIVRVGKLYYTEGAHYQLVDIPYLSSDYALTLLVPRAFSDATIADHPQAAKYAQMERLKTSLNALLADDRLLNGPQLHHELTHMHLIAGTVVVPAFSLDNKTGTFALSSEGLPPNARALRVRPGSPYPRFFVSAHRPFLFFLRHTRSSAVLLAGAVEAVKEKPFKSKYGNKVKQSWIE